MLLGKSRIITTLKKAAKASPADETLIAAQRGTFTTLRFAGGRIHQNFHEEEITVWIKVSSHGRMGIATTCSLNHDAIMRAIQTATTIAEVSHKQSSPAFSTAPPKQPTPELTTHSPHNSHFPLVKAVEDIRTFSNQSNAHKMELAGSFVVGEDELAVVGSRGLVQYQPFSVSGVRLVATQGKASGFAAQTARDVRTLNWELLAERAWRFCQKNKNPQALPLGAYDVLLEPEAVAELLEWTSYIGFGAKQLHERTSFMAGRIGERIFDRSISITEDATDPAGMAVPFDYEGVPKQRVALIDRGVAKEVVYDSHYAKLFRRAPTGHAMAYDEFEGPTALNLFMAPGQTPYRDMLKKMDRGLWINRFHYISGLLKTQEALMTGLTRDGTFLVKKGEVVGAVKNLRFTQSMLEAFSNIVAISRERKLFADPSQGLSAVVVPALLIKNFHFSGQTQ